MCRRVRRQGVCARGCRACRGGGRHAASQNRCRANTCACRLLNPLSSCIRPPSPLPDAGVHRLLHSPAWLCSTQGAPGRGGRGVAQGRDARHACAALHARVWMLPLACLPACLLASCPPPHPPHPCFPTRPPTHPAPTPPPPTQIPSLTEGGTLWFTDLTIADPTYALPALAGLSFLATIELGAADGMEGQPEATRKRMKAVMRVVALAVPFLSTTLPASVFMYWTGEGGQHASSRLVGTTHSCMHCMGEGRAGGFRGGRGASVQSRRRHGGQWTAVGAALAACASRRRSTRCASSRPALPPQLPTFFRLFRLH